MEIVLDFSASHLFCQHRNGALSNCVLEGEIRVSVWKLVEMIQHWGVAT